VAEVEMQREVDVQKVAAFWIARLSAALDAAGPGAAEASKPGPTKPEVELAEAVQMEEVKVDAATAAKIAAAAEAGAVLIGPARQRPVKMPRYLRCPDI